MHHSITLMSSSNCIFFCSPLYYITMFQCATFYYSISGKFDRNLLKIDYNNNKYYVYIAEI